MRTEITKQTIKAQKEILISPTARHVTMHNYLTESRYCMLLNDLRLTMLAISKVWNGKIVNKELCDAQIITVNTPFILTLDEIMEAYNFTSKDATILLMKQVAANLLDCKLEVLNLDNSGNYIGFNWFTKVEYCAELHTIEFFFSDKIIPYISQLSGKFSNIPMEYFSKLRGFYSCRLYMYLLQVQNAKHKTKKVQLQELRKILSVGNKYGTFSTLKQQILTPAIEEISEKTNIEAEFTPITGRNGAVREIIFKFEKKHGKKEETAA